MGVCLITTRPLTISSNNISTAEHNDAAFTQLKNIMKLLSPPQQALFAHVLAADIMDRQIQNAAQLSSLLLGNFGVPQVALSIFDLDSISKWVFSIT